MTRKEDVIRFAVVREGKPLSGVWRVWRRNNDIYVSPRAVAGSYKVSLHASGRFRFGFTSDEKAERFLKEGDDCAVFKWERPQLGSSAVLLLQVVFPALCLLAPNHTPTLPSKLVELVVPKEGNATMVSLIETTIDPTVTEIEIPAHSTRTLAKWDLPDGRRIWIVEHEETSSAEFNQSLLEFRKDLRIMTRDIPADSLPSVETSHLRTFVSMHANDGIVRFVEIDAEHIR